MTLSVEEVQRRGIWPRLKKEQRNYLIQSVWREGISAKEIANAVGATKNSIIGHYAKHRESLSEYPLPMSPGEKHRLGLISDATVKTNYHRERAKNKKYKSGNASSVRLSFPAKNPDWPSLGIEAIERFPKVHASLAKTEYDDTGLMVRLEDNNGCMWPLNDGGPYLFCGHAKLGKYAYCQHHHVRSLGVGTEGERRAHKIGERHV